MPIYEYQCPNCKTEFELRLTLSQVDCSALCPKCQTASKRMISSFACKTGSNIQPADKPLRESTDKPLWD